MNGLQWDYSLIPVTRRDLQELLPTFIESEASQRINLAQKVHYLVQLPATGLYPEKLIVVELYSFTWLLLFV
jgi:hypothetical protein